jgi:Histidine phosphatase superfamily (branch 2)
MWTNPSSLFTNAENPALISAVSVFRHGQRVPIHKHHAVDSSTGWEDAILRPHDEVCLPPVEMLHTSTAAKLPLPGSPSEPKRALPTFGSKDAPAGTLTRNGLRQLISVGADLRKRYLTADDVKSCLIPAGMTPEDAARRGLLYLRTTHTPRTLQSLQGVVSGLAGSDESAPKDASPVPVYSLSTQHESLYPNASHCPELISMAVEGG